MGMFFPPQQHQWKEVCAENKETATDEKYQGYVDEKDENETGHDIDLSGILEGSTDGFHEPRAIHHRAKDSIDFLNGMMDWDDGTDSTESSSCSFYDDESEVEVSERCDAGEGLEEEDLERRVRFGNVTVREYASTIGDHPFCHDSCPLSLDWQHSEATKYEVETFECKRFLNRRNVPRRLNLDQRRSRILETTHVGRSKLRKMELERTMDTLRQSIHGMDQILNDIVEFEESSCCEEKDQEPTEESYTC